VEMREASAEYQTEQLLFDRNQRRQLMQAGHEFCDKNSTENDTSTVVSCSWSYCL